MHFHIREFWHLRAAEEMSINRRRKLKRNFPPNCMKGEESCQWLTLKLKRLHRWQDSLCLESAEYIHPLENKSYQSKKKQNPHYLHNMQNHFSLNLPVTRRFIATCSKSLHEWWMLLMLKHQIIKLSSCMSPLTLNEHSKSYFLQTQCKNNDLDEILLLFDPDSAEFNT